MSEQRLADIRPGEVIEKDILHGIVDAFKYVAPVDPFLVKGSRRGDRERVAFVPVKFRVNAVHRERFNGENVCNQRLIGPGRIDFAACHIFDVVFVFHIIIAGGGITRCAVMYDDIFRDDDTVKNDLSARFDRFDLGFGDFRRIIAVQCVSRYHDDVT